MRCARFYLLIGLLSICPLLAVAQLVVTVSPAKIIAQKAVVELRMTNDLPHKIESARAICFLLDGQGKMVGQASRWVIGGTKAYPALEPKKATTYSFVITSPQPLTTTNLTAKVAFTRLILAEGKVANPRDEIVIQPFKQR